MNMCFVWVVIDFWYFELCIVLPTGEAFLLTSITISAVNLKKYNKIAILWQVSAKLVRGHSGCLLEFLNEVAGVIEAYFQCNLCDRGIGVQKQGFWFLNAQIIDVGDQGLAGILLEQFHKVVFAVIGESSELCCGQLLWIIKVDVVQDLFNRSKTFVLFLICGSDVISHEHFVEKAEEQSL